MLLNVTTLKGFQGMLHGVDIHVFTNHKNLTSNTLKMQPVLHWHTKIEECSPCYITSRAHAIFEPTTFQGFIA
jgi:hypothetical protein